MKTILHICDWYRPIGGAEKLLFDTLELLESNGHTNVIVYDDRAGQDRSGRRKEYACKGLEPYWPGSLGHRRLLIAAARRRLQRIIRQQKPDVCHIHNLQNSYVTEYLADTIPTVRAIHDPRLYCFTWWRLLPDKSICPHPLGEACLANGCLSGGLVPRTIYDLQARWALRNFNVHRKVHVLIAESRMAIESLLQNGYDPARIAWLPNFTPLDPPEAVERFVAAHHDPQKPIVLFVGRASYEKGAQVLLEAAKHVTDDCRIVLITAGPELEGIRRLAAPLGSRVEIIGGLSYDETRQWYARSTAVVVPSVWLENFGLVGLEAYANMKPVIGSRVGGINDWLLDGRTGWFFEMGNARELAARIDEAVSDLQVTASMGRAGYERAREYYSQEHYLPRLLGIYQKAIDAFAR